MVGEQSSQSSIDMEWEFEGITDSQMNNFETEGRIGRARSASPSLRAPRALSQHSSYSEFGTDDIDELILGVNEELFPPVPATQKSSSSEDTAGSKSTNSIATSTTSLGKRSAGEAPLDGEGPSKRQHLSRSIDAPTLHVQPRQPLDRSTSLDNIFSDKVPAPRRLDSGADKPYIIASSVNLLTMMNKRNIPYGVRYEIARYMTLNLIAERHVGMDQIAKLQALGPSNAEAAPHVLSILKDENDADVNDTSSRPTLFDKEIAARSPWAELDKEETMIPDCTSRKGVGFQDCDDPEWFGGKISFRGSIKYENSKFKIVLDPPELGTSDRFARAFGSKSRITLKASSTRGCTKEILLPFLKRPFVIWDVVYRAFLEDDGTVFLIATNEVLDNTTERIDPTKKEPSRMDFMTFINWHNPLHLNPKQAMAKWAARFNLGRSTSVPGLILETSNILYEEDIESQQDSDMTDGCGFINLAGLKFLHKNLHLGDFPAAVQCRVAGAKGLLIRHPTDTSEEAKVWLRPSMIKVKHSTDVISNDITLRTIDVLKVSHPPGCGRLNYQTIINLAENGVPEKAFDNLVRTRLEEMAEVFTSLDNVEDQKRIWREACATGGVMGARLARRHRELARLVGHQKTRPDDLETDGDTDLSTPQSTPWEWDQTSGQPSSLAETVMAALDSGMYDVPAFREKLRNMVGSLLEQYALSYRTEIPMSLVAFIAPDPTGCLKPGQIFFKSSHRTLEQPNDPTSDTVLGPILLTRNPCRLPTDVQKWEAVDVPELRDHLDVIYLPIQGSRRAADFLAGDYDGDTALLIWQPELVEPFRNAELHFADEPANLRKEYFLPVVETVADFELRTAKLVPGSPAYIHSLQDHLLGNVFSNSAVGRYSQMHEAACYEKGYSDPDTIRLAYMFCLILDGSKSGLRVNLDKMKIDTQKFKVAEMVWRERLAKDFKTRATIGGGVNEDNRRSAKRGSGLKGFIMDHMYSFGKSENVRIGELLNKSMGGDKLKAAPDSALLKPWRDAEIRAEKAKKEFGSSLFSDELEAIKKHVEEVYKMHRSEFGSGSRSPSKKLLQMSPSKKGARAALSDIPIEKRQDKIRKVSLAFQQPIAGRETMLCFAGQELNELKASYAYLHDWEQNRDSWIKCFTHFPWDVAFRDLCAIKAKSTSSGWKAVRIDFYESMMVKIRS